MKLIKINDNHYVIVDDSEIKEGDYALSKLNQIVVFGKNYTPSLYRKITHSTQPLEEFVDSEGIKRIGWVNIKVLELSEVKELLGEVDVEKKAREIVINNNPFGSENFSVSTFNGLVKDITKALEDNKEKKYTEEDMKKIRQILVEGAITNMSCSSAVVELDKYIQSLQPKTEWEVEIVDGKLKLK